MSKDSPREMNHLTLVVDPGDHSYEDTIVETSFELSVGETRAVLLEEFDAQGNLRSSVPAQRLDDVWVWVLAGETRRGRPRHFRVTSSAGKPLLDNPLYDQRVRLRTLHPDPEQDRVLEIEIDGGYVATYNYGWQHGGLWKPYFHPILAPSGLPITQNSEFPGTQRGHYWHRGLFVAHQRINGISFWEERDGKTGRILHQSFEHLDEGPVVGRFVEHNLWRTPAGVDLVDERREVRIYRVPANQRILDFKLVLKPVDEPITLGKAAYNLLACHVPRSMHIADPLSAYDRRMYRPSEMRPGVRGGRVETSEGEINVDRNHTTPGSRARWVDHSGPVEGHWQGIATFDHPLNPRHPTYWLNWNNMTHAPSFTFSEPYTIERGDALTLRYRVYIHDGSATAGKVEQRWHEYAFAPAITLS
jgi:hypothetical protein